MKKYRYFSEALMLIALFASGCDDNPATTAPPNPVATDFAFVITTDFSTGSASSRRRPC